MKGPFSNVWVHKFWPLIAPKLQKLIDHEFDHGFTLDSLYNQIMQSKFQVWLTNDHAAVLLTSMSEQPDGAIICSLCSAGGENVVENRDEILTTVEHYARMHGCYGIEIVGRKGWERVVRDYGYEHFYTAQIKVLDQPTRERRRPRLMPGQGG